MLKSAKKLHKMHKQKNILAFLYGTKGKNGRILILKKKEKLKKENYTTKN